MKYQFPLLIPAAYSGLKDRIANVVGRWRFRLLTYLWGVKWDALGSMSGPTVIRANRVGSIQFGKNVCFVSRVTQNVVGVTNPSILDTRWGGRIVIGDYCGFSSPAISAKTLIKIGNRLKCGANVRIFDHDFHSVEAAYRSSAEDTLHVRSKPIEIGDDVFIGANAIILKGTKIGNRSIVAAGSVVCGLDIPDDSLVGGNPAVVISRKG